MFRETVIGKKQLWGRLVPKKRLGGGDCLGEVSSNCLCEIHGYKIRLQCKWSCLTCPGFDTTWLQTARDNGFYFGGHMDTEKLIKGASTPSIRTYSTTSNNQRIKTSDVRTESGLEH